MKIQLKTCTLFELKSENLGESYRKSQHEIDMMKLM